MTVTTRLTVFVGRLPSQTGPADEAKRVTDSAYGGLAVLLALAAVYVAFLGDLAVMLVVAAAGVSAGLLEIERRRARPSHRGLLAVVAGPRELVFESRRGGLRYGILAVVFALVTFVAFIGVATSDAQPNRAFALFALAAVLALVQGVRIIVVAAAAPRIRIDRTGIEVRTGRRMRAFAWPEVRGAEARGASLRVLSEDGRAVKVRSVYLESDPVIIAEMVTRFASDPSSRALIGADVVERMRSDAAWRIGA